jgi:hypothetical protein
MTSLMDWFRRGRSGYAPLPGPNGGPNNGAPDQGTRPIWTRRATKFTGLTLMVVVVGYLAITFMSVLVLFTWRLPKLTPVF